jgi:GxxExxY protein
MLHADVTERVIGAAIAVHSGLGPGLLESAYHACLLYQFGKSGLRVESEVRLPVAYGDVKIDAGYRLDFLVEDCVVLEIKAVEKILPIHLAQMLTYLKLSTRPVGLLINFNVAHLREGIRRVSYEYALKRAQGLPSRFSWPSAVEERQDDVEEEQSS